MLTDVQIRNMLELQAEMNVLVNPEWVAADYPFMQAIVVEGAEAIEHIGYKWWKAQTRDVAQLQMELVDIWHFFLSEVLQSVDGNATHAAALLKDDLSSLSEYVEFDRSRYAFDHLDELSRYELLIGLAVSRRFSTGLFLTLLVDAEMDWGALYKQYIGKNVLNRFRQNHGYKEGYYVKDWGGREDNEHLTEILSLLDGTDPSFCGHVYDALAYRYRWPVSTRDSGQATDVQTP